MIIFSEICIQKYSINFDRGIHRFEQCVPIGDEWRGGGGEIMGNLRVRRNDLATARTSVLIVAITVTEYISATGKR